ncbi:MAG TPA: oxidoreductase [Mycobacterium sp.]|nr:oxidoreductase [Mycobacterium sp.]
MPRAAQPMRPEHAVVIGASIAGLCAARLLADHFDRVTLYERDDLPDGPVDRSAIPQGQHVHLLMARGAQELEGLFPGLLDDMAADGMPVLRNRPGEIHFTASGHVLGTGRSGRDGFTGYLPSRALLEWHVRTRVKALPRVQIVRGDVDEPVFDPAADRVTGVVLDGGVPVSADLVVEASGRGSRLPTWMQQWGFEQPRVDTVKVGVTYASHRVRIPVGMMPEKMVVVGAAQDRPLGLGMLFHEDGAWTVTAFGVGGAQPPRDNAGVCELADDVVPAHIATALRAGEPMGTMKFHTYPTAKWRRYDKLARLPQGIVPFGDAVVSLNPTFGQGVTMSALQAATLRRVLAGGTHDLVRRLARATARTIMPVWTMNAVADISAHRAQGPRQWWYRPAYQLMDQFLGAAESDSTLAEWFLRRTSLLDSLWVVPPPSLIGRTIRHNSGAWLAERRASRTRPTAVVEDFDVAASGSGSV